MNFMKTNMSSKWYLERTVKDYLVLIELVCVALQLSFVDTGTSAGRGEVRRPTVVDLSVNKLCEFDTWSRPTGHE